jgi:hypothetical protein
MRVFTLSTTVALILGTVSATRNVGSTIKISNGAIIIGHHSTRNARVAEYLGIPYAAPPVGGLRFMPPKKFVSNGTIHADRYVGTSMMNAEISLTFTSRRSYILYPKMYSSS